MVDSVMDWRDAVTAPSLRRQKRLLSRVGAPLRGQEWPF
jgi:hypothetical protein